MIRTEPDTFGELLEIDGSVRFHFNERISENVAGGDLSAAASVSPRTGEVRVSHGRSSITVSLEGGFQPGLLYRVTLLPIVSDMFGNPMRDAFELVFSTGGAPAPTGTVAGEVWDRVSGQGVNGATVQAIGSDSLVHVARADNQGVFALRYLPTGDFVLTGYDDRDRNQLLGAQEVSGALTASVSEGDTLLVGIPVLAPDTTPALAGAARALDSVTVVLEFDDYLDPEAPTQGVDASLTRDAAAAPTIVRLLHEAEYERYVDEITDSLARLDSLDAAAAAEAAAAAVAAASTARDSLEASSGDSVPPDSLAVADGVVVDSVAADSIAADSLTAGAAPDAPEARPRPPRLEGAASQTRPGVTLPGRRLVGLLDGPLQEGEYRVLVSSVVNINGLVGGGGEATLVYAPPPPDSLATGAADAPAPADSSTVGVPAQTDTTGPVR